MYIFRIVSGCTDDGNGQAVATDLGFMLDASASLTANGYKEEKEFIKSVIDKVGGISAKGIHVGVVVYSDEATLRIKFDAHDNTEDLKRAIDDLAYDRKQTRIDLGLEKAKEMFSVTGGGRGNSKKVRFFSARINLFLYEEKIVLFWYVIRKKK